MKHISFLMLYVILHIMDFSRIRQKETVLIIAIILVFALLGLWLRLLPMEQLTSGPVPKVIFNDPWYSLRQIEVIAHNFPRYPWFDPMIGYPVGKDIDWGPLYPTLSAAIAILLGATNRPDIMFVSSWIPPLFSLLMIPILYKAGTIVADRKTGIIAACLISVIAGEYLYRSFYGYLDHHFLEVILSTAFILLYLIIIRKITKNRDDFHGITPNLFIYSVSAGLVYYLGMMNMPTIVLFAGIIGLFCLLHAIISGDEEGLKTLTIIHSIIFGIFIILFALTGIHESGFSLDRYTPVQIFLALCLIIEPAFFYCMIRFMPDKPRWQRGMIIIGIPILLFILASGILPSVTGRFTDAINYFFFTSYLSTQIAEMRMWDLTRAFHSFNISLGFMILGILISGYQICKKYNPVSFCSFVWAIIILFSTIMHLRYEYYAAVIVVLYSAIALSWMYESIRNRHVVENNPDAEKKKGGKKTEIQSWKKNSPIIIIMIAIGIITILSVQMTWVVATKEIKVNSMDNDWGEALTWLEQNSPSPALDNLKIYEKDGFHYPDTTYGILSAWDYGHWIAYLAKRIPITTPFQNNVPKTTQFLITTDEQSAENLANATGVRYIITDYEMISSKFSSLSLYAIGQEAKTRYQTYYYQESEESPGRYDSVLTLKQDFFNAMVSRLYIFDGSLTNSTGASLIRYSRIPVGGTLIPAISESTFLSPEEAEKASKSELAPGTDLISLQYTHPVASIPALSHYRLVHESPTRIAADEYAQLYSVKIFERVAGYHIPGTGILEIPLISNQGREFVYRQNSTDGEFIVPYSTKRDTTGVRALGPYRNTLTGETFEVSEKQVLKGE